MGDVTEITGKGKGKRARPKQERIPGTEGPRRNAALEKAAAAYVDARDERMELTEKEVEKQDALVTAMEKAGLETYRCEDTNFVVEISKSTKAKVRKVKDMASDEGGDSDSE